MEHVFYAKYFHRIIFFIFLISGSQLCRGEAYYYPVPVEQTVRSFLPPMPPPPLDCNDPLVGKGVVVDKVSGALASLLSNSPDFDNAIDGDLSNYTEIGLTSVTGVGSVSLISVKDLTQDYPAGQRAGFVLEITNGLNGLLGADVLNSLQLRTYLDNELQETAFTGGGAPISLNVLSGQGKKRRLDFLTTEPFDEIELVFTGVASSSLLSTFRIYYAYEEIDGCNYNCATALTTAHYPSVTASTDCEVSVPVLGCTDVGFNNFSNTTNSDTTDYASDPFLLLESHYLDLNIGQDIPAGYDVGFAVQQVGLLGILDVNVLGGMVITTYNNGNPTPVETFNANTSLANVAALSSGVNLISFKVSQPFDQVRIRVTSALSILTTYRIYYGFIRPDSDGDGFPDCVDKCAGNDNLDADGDGTPDACDTDCMVDAGLDATACPPDPAFALSPAGVGETWSAAAGNPSSATIDSNGDISGLSAEGTYLFVLSNGACSDTVAVDYLYTQGDLSCNDPMAGPGTVISDNGSCTLCGDPNAGNLLDGDLSNYIQYGNLLSLSLGGGASALVSVQDTNRTFGANTRVGFTVSFPSGLLSVGLLDAFVLRTYNNGVLAETATSGGGLLTADAVAATGQQRIAFVASQDFDEVELVVQGGLVSLDLLTTIRIFYAFTEPENCPSSDNITDITDVCGIPLTASADYCAAIAYDHSGFTGVGCVGCIIDSLSNVVDEDLTRPATIDLIAAALGAVSVSVRTMQVIPGGAEAGFAVGIEPSLLAAGLLDDIELTTYLGGSQVENLSGSSPLVTANLLGGGADVNFISFVTTSGFDEIQITFDATLASSSALGGTIDLFYGFVRYDADADGSPDCMDKCCGSPDYLDMDADGLPDGCDSPLFADDDTGATDEDMSVVIDVIANDDFGQNGPGNAPVQVIINPNNGVASVADGGTPNDPSDDMIQYSPNPDFNGMDTLAYTICDANFSCDTALVIITVNAVDDPVTAMDDTASTNEDNPVIISPVVNDLLPDGGAGTITVTSAPSHGTYTIDNNGTPNDPTDDTLEYTPDADYNGPDQITYQVCDADGDCDTAVIDITVNSVEEAVTAVNDPVMTNEDTPVTVTPAANDLFPDGANGMVTILSGPANGSIVLNDNGTPNDPTDDTIDYTPNADYNGPDLITYQVCDADGDCDTADITIIVNSVNDPVTAVDDPVMTDEDTPVTVMPGANDLFPDGPAGMVTVLSGPTHGSIVLDDNGTPNDPTDDTLEYTPDADYNGPDQITYQVCDADGGCDTADIIITVNSVDDAVTAADDGATTNEDTPVTVTPAANDLFPDGATGMVTVLSGPSNGTIVFSDNGTPNDPTDDTIEYTPGAGFLGTDAISYQVCDADGDCDTADITFNVVDPNAQCNNPITGKGVVVDQISGSLASLLSNSPDFDNAIDGDLSNYTEIGLTSVTGIGTVSLISVKDENQVYPAGLRTGFVVEITNSIGGLLGADVLNSLQIHTYLDNQLQEIAEVGGGTSIDLNLMGGQGKKRRVDFLTTAPFDEVELVFTGVANSSLLSTIRIYYAYEEVDGCSYNCDIALTTPNFPSVTASTNCELFIGTCLEDGFNNFNNTTNADTTDSATDVFILAETNFLNLDIGEDIPAGYEVGFAVEQGSLLGLLTVDVLGGIVITTYNDGSPVPVETFFGDADLANVGVLSGGINLISFRTSQVFDEVRITLTSVLPASYRIYYGFIRPDSDGDEVPDCIDKCAGNDNLDADGDGTPDACDSDCMVNAGLDATACPPDGSFSLSPAGAGETWSAVAGNPSAATIDNNGDISGLSAEGTYLFVLSNGACTDTAAVNYFYTRGDLSCNDPLAGPGMVISDNGLCQLCGDADAANLVDGDLSNYIGYGNLLALSIGGGTTPLVAVQDTNRTYGTGTRVGFTVSFPAGLLSAGLLDAFVLRTYNNGVLAETASTGGGALLTADVIAGSGQQRLAFVASQDFDEVELLVQGGVVTLDLLTSVRIYYAFTEPETCPSADNITDITDICGEVLSSASVHCASISYENSGFTGTGCVGCLIDSLSNVVDEDLTRPATISLTAAALGEVSVSVRSVQTMPGGAEAGFALSVDASLLAAGLLDDVTLTTYLGGSQVESFSGSSPAISVGLLNGGSDVNFISFPTTADFDEIQLTLDANLASSSALGGDISVYYGFVRYDSDGDGAPDCMDKCCGEPDYLDADGDGLPDGCDMPIDAMDDTATTDEDMAAVVDVVANDDFGQNGPGMDTVRIVSAPANGTATVQDGGTPNDPTDDTILYTPDMDFFGMDTLSYAICDANFSCDTALVVLTVNPVDDPVTATDDPVITDEDTPVVITPGANDALPDGGAGTITVVTGPTNGTYVIDDNGTPADPADDTIEYTPDPNFNGMDLITYQICDADGDCDTADITITVNPVDDAVTAVDDPVTTDEDMPVMISPVTNDMFPDGASGAVTVTSGPANGTYAVNDNGTPTDPTDDTIEYTPDPDFNGLDMITYQVCDADGDCDTADIIITVNPVDDAVTAVDDPVTTDEDTPLVISPVTNDMLPDGGNGTITVTSGPNNGNAVMDDGGTPNDPSDDTIQYMPNADFNGMDTISYQVCDVDGDCDTADIIITVNPVNDATDAVDDMVATNMDTPVTVTPGANDLVPDGGAGTITVISGPVNGTYTLDDNGTPNDPTDDTIEYTPDPGFVGADMITYQICDVDNDCDQAVITFNVFDPNIGCNNPIAGKMAIVDQFSAGLSTLLLGGTDYEAVVDTNLENYVELDISLAVAGATLVSVKDLDTDYPAGRRVGFVIESVGGLLTADVLQSLRMNTYLDNALQESEDFIGGAASVSLLGGPGGKRRVAFVTNQPFDEVELALSSTVSGLTALRIYYAYQEDPACNSDCTLAVIPNNGFTPAIVGARTGDNGLCVLCFVQDANDLIDNDTLGTPATLNFGVALGGSLSISTSLGSVQPAGTDAGFVIRQDDVLNLLDLSVLGNYRIRTYEGGTLRDDEFLNGSVANVGLLPGNNLLSVSITSTQPFDEIRLTVNRGVNLIEDTEVYYAFIREDADNDGVPDCIDKCPGGDDNILNNQGEPLGCNPVCPDVAGLDVNACPGTDGGSAQLPAAPVGYTWSAVPGNPSVASIDNNGTVTGMSAQGVYYFALDNGVCFDTVAVNFLETQGNISCNDPLAGPDVVINNNGGCELCGAPNAGNITDGDLSNYVQYGNLLALSIGGGSTPLIAVRDTVQEYPAGTRTGFVVSFPSGLLSVSLLDAFSLRTYNNGVLVETATHDGGGLLTTDAVAASGQQRFAFVSTAPFDEVELVIRSGFVTLDLLTTIRVYYAFTEPESCPSSDNITDITDICGQILTASSGYCGMLGYENTGFSGVNCTECRIDSLSNLVDDDFTRPATIELTASAIGEASVSVKTIHTLPAGAEAGYAVSVEASLLTAGVLDDLTLTTYLDGVEQETYSGSSPLISVALLTDSLGINFISFVTTLDFDEVRLSVDASIASSSVLGGTLSVYYAYVRYDSDGDGTPDCLDKCCSGPDYLDEDGDGNPDACDVPCVTISAWIYLEGGLIASDGTQNYDTIMRTSLNDLRLLPGQTYEDFFNGPVFSPVGQPFNTAPWHYNGTEGDAFDSGGNPAPGDAGYAPTVVDWVLVSLRDTPDGAGGPLCQAAALVHNDGHLEFVQDFDCCNLDLNGSYYLVIEHQNHLIVMSDQPVPVINGMITYDFRYRQSYIDDPFGFGIFVGQKALPNGLYAMYGANGNQVLTGSSDTDINFDDRSFWEAVNGTIARYRSADYNLNGDVNFNDRRLWELNNGKFTSVPRD